MMAAATIQVWATRPLAAPVGAGSLVAPVDAEPPAVVVPETTGTEVSGSGDSTTMAVGVPAVGPTVTVELETDQWLDGEASGVEMRTGSSLDVARVVVRGSGVEDVEGSAGASEEGSTEVVGTALEDFRGQSTAVGLH